MSGVLIKIKAKKIISLSGLKPKAKANYQITI